MVSSESLKSLIWILRITYYMGTSPARWDTTLGRFIINYGPGVTITIPFMSSIQICIGKVAPVFYTLFQTCVISQLICFLVFVPLSALDTFICSFIFVCFIMSYVAQLQLLRNIEDFCSLLNNFLKFDAQIRK